MNKELSPNELIAITAKNMILIQGHLQSIRNMMTFFTVMLILDMIYQFLATFFR